MLTLLHKPLGGTCSSTNANGMHIVRKPRLVYLLRTFYLITVRIDRMTLLEKHLAIARLTSRHKQYQIVLGRKGGNIRHAVSHLPADGIKALERSPWLYVLLNIFYNTMKSVERLGSLRVKIDIAREVETFHIIHLSTTMARLSVCPTRPSTSA